MVRSSVLRLGEAAPGTGRQEKNLPDRPPRPPSFEDVRYGPHEPNVLDLYLAKSDQPAPLVVWIDGGAWVGSDKKVIPLPPARRVQEAGITVASINHRYATQRSVPRAVPRRRPASPRSPCRLHAKEHNLNPKAVAVTGGPSGADIALWLAFHDDLAEPASDDPVKRQSTAPLLRRGTRRPDHARPAGGEHTPPEGRLPEPAPARPLRLA